MTRWLPFLLTLAVGCDAATPRYVTVGDNTAVAPTHRTSGFGLLADNDDALMPMFQGRSLTAKHEGGYELVRLERGGDSFHNLADDDAPMCTCRADACNPGCVDVTAHDDTTVIVQLGGNDLVAAFLTLVDDDALRADPAPLLERFRADVRKVLGGVVGAFDSAPKRVLVLNVYDPSDGTGDVAAIAAEILPPNFGIDASVVTSTLGRDVLGGYNTIIAEETAAVGGELVDVYTHFLGHGAHHDEPAHPRYVASDPTGWLRGALDPPVRGAHELRRVLWRALFGEDVAEVPKDLPPTSLLDVPPVPANGWAKRVVAEAITESIYSPTLDVEWPNFSGDAQLVLGPPEGGTDTAVAVGVRGAFLVVDLGADTAATDGEGEDLVVLEYGALSGGVPEPYRVSVSNTEAGPFTIVADGRGERAFDLAEAGVRSARFIKVESLAAEVDVLEGLGSPTAPGPELDAIGAVYPGSP